METIKISIPEGFEIDKMNAKTGEVSFRPIGKKYPKRIFEITNIKDKWELFKCVVATGVIMSDKRRDAVSALCKLVEFRDEYNKIDGFVVDWNNVAQDKYCIKVYYGKIDKQILVNTQSLLYFGSDQTRNIFMQNFEPLMELAKEFL